jgi:hypothetical protein
LANEETEAELQRVAVAVSEDTENKPNESGNVTRRIIKSTFLILRIFGNFFFKFLESPGENCRRNPDICTGGSFCYNGYCICPEGYIENLVEKDCRIPKIYADPGESCDRPVNAITQALYIFICENAK